MDCDEDYVMVPTSSSSETSETSEDREEDTQIHIDDEPVDVVLNMDIMQDIPQNVQQPGIGRRVIVQILRSFRVLTRLSKIAMNHVLISHVLSRGVLVKVMVFLVILLLYMKFYFLGFCGYFYISWINE